MLRSEDLTEKASPMLQTGFSNNNDNNDDEWLEASSIPQTGFSNNNEDESLEESPILDRYIPSNNLVKIDVVYSPIKIMKLKQESFSRDDYIDDEDFDEVLKKLNNDSNDKTTFMSVKLDDIRSDNDDTY